MPSPRANYISIFVTTNCGLQCLYCYTKQGRADNVIDVGFARQGIDDFFQSTGHRGIRFQGGGEPTLRLAEMNEILVSTRKKWGDVSVELQTNGTFNDDVKKWVADNVDIVWMSHDGPGGVHDIQRPDKNGNPTSKVVEKNIEYLVNQPHITVGVRSTITSLNVHKQPELVEFFSAMGIKTIYGDNLFGSGYNDDMKVIYDVPGWENYTNGLLAAKVTAKKLGVFYGSWITINFAEKVTHNCTSCTPYPRLTTDGYVSSCDMTSMGEDGPDIFVYGKWNSRDKKIEYYPEKSKHLASRNLTNLPKCKNCPVGNHCAGSCAGRTYFLTGDIFKVDKDTCRATRSLAAALPLGQGREPFELEHP